uniref:Magnesium transporter MgtE intracellular domain-containing protein n=1 Tax=Fundidesulfovibrio putealis TaxID=270496 RepID=A0A7C4EJ01_9BACT
MNAKKTASSRLGSTKWQRFAIKPRLSRIVLAVAALAVVKLGVLVSMGLRAPQAPAVPAPRAQAAVAPASQAPSAGITAPVTVARAVILDDAPAHAAQQAPAAAPPAQKPQPQAAPESVLSIQVLKQRAEALDRQEQALKTLEADLNTRLARLKELETTLKSMLDEAKSIKDEKMRHLIDVYTNMKAKQAASVLETLDENVAVKILAGMKGRQAGEILTFVSAKKAAKLSEELTKFQVGPDLPQKP